MIVLTTDYYGTVVEFLLSLFALAFIFGFMIIIILIFKLLKYNTGRWVKDLMLMAALLVIIFASFFILDILESVAILLILQFAQNMLLPLYIMPLIIILKKRVNSCLRFLVLLAIFFRMIAIVKALAEPYIDVSANLLLSLLPLVYLMIFTPVYMSYDIWVKNRNLRSQKNRVADAAKANDIFSAYSDSNVRK